ncbi:hypothetical protein MMC13_003867 [Lambiella insularis]|nr:hypothetical protein [Lambiella insularis]
MPGLVEDGLVNGDDGYISDDSSFYGVEETNESSLVSSSYSATLPPTYLKYTTLALINLSPLTSPKFKTLYSPHEGSPSGRQLDEPLSHFLTRLPPLTTHESFIGPWIWVSNPDSTFRPTDQNIAGMMARGERILSDFEDQRDKLEKMLAGKARGAISRKINPIREKVRTALLESARKNGCTTGKWMLFPMEEGVNRVWGTIAKATVDGHLGIDAKVATDQGKGLTTPRLICVYTQDFGDKKDLKRVLRKLAELGLLGEKGEWGQDKLLYYKPDVFTYLGIERDNEWGLKASLFSSKEALSWPE